MTQITFTATPHPMGWSVIAKRGTFTAVVAVGLISPDPTLAWCKSHLQQVHMALDKSQLALSK